MMFQRLTIRKACVILIVPGVILLYACFEASRGVLSSSSASGSYLLNGWLLGPGRKDVAGNNGGKIILMSYPRSGSSFTSEIIQRDPKVFYSFEPLWAFHRRSFERKMKYDTLFPNDTALMEAYDKKSIQILETVLTCGFETMAVNDINNFQMRNSVDSRLLWMCVQKARNLTAYAAVECFLNARKVCLSRPIKVAKVIHFRGVAARQLLKRHDDLKLVYLVRDPRGTLSSHVSVFGMFKWNEVKNYSAIYCEIFRQDLKEVEQFFDQYPARVKLLRYETLAEHPLKASEELYRFLGLNYTAAVREFVFNHTIAGQKFRGAYSTSRPNSTEAAYYWKRRMPLAAAQTIDSNCRDVYEKLGYIPVKSKKELQDSAARFVKPVTFHGQAL